MVNEYEFDLRQLLLVLKRRRVLIIASISLFTALAAFYSFVLAVPKYKATTLVYIDMKTSDKVSDTSSLVRVGLNEGDILSEVEVMVSGRVINGAIKKLGWEKGKTEREIQEIADSIVSHTKVSRLDKSYVLSLDYVAEDPKEAADVANAIAESYMDEQVSALSEITTRTAGWLQAQVKDLRTRAIQAQKDAENYRSKYNSESMTKEGEDGGRTAGGDFSLVEMQSLDREAEAYKSLHDDYLEKLKAASSQESFPITDVRIVTKAVPPLEKYSPKPVLLLGIAAILGAGLGVFLSLLLDNMDKGLRRIGQVKREVGVGFLGFVPKTQNSKFDLIVKGDRESRKCEVPRTFTYDKEYLNTIRTLKNEIDQAEKGKKSRVIGFVSPNENESFSLPLNLASYISQTATCVFVDANFRSTKRIDGEGLYFSKGFGESLSSGVDIKAAQFIHDHEGGRKLAVLSPGAMTQDIFTDAVTLDNIGQLMKALEEKFDYVIVNVPSLLAKAEAYSFIQNVDKIVVMAKWGKTKPNDLNFVIAQNKIEKEKILGLTLTDTDMAAMEKHYGHKFAS